MNNVVGKLKKMFLNFISFFIGLNFTHLLCESRATKDRIH